MGLSPSCQPFLQMPGNEGVVGEIGVLAADAVDLLQLTGAEAFMRIEAPQPLHQALPPQYFMAACDAAVEVIGDVEERAVAIGDAGIERQEVGGQGVLGP